MEPSSNLQMWAMDMQMWVMTHPQEAFKEMVRMRVAEHQLYRALLLAKSDAEKNGFSYGPQSTIVKAIKAYQKASTKPTSPQHPSPPTTF